MTTHHIPLSAIRTRSGRFVDLCDPTPSSICILDVAHALSNICRFTGHTSQFYSVAEHAYHASYLVPREHAFEALMHDATEAYLGDVSSPLKALLPEYRLLEDRMQVAVSERFKLPDVMSPAVKVADREMLLVEQRWAMGSHETWAQLKDVPMRAVKLNFWSPMQAMVEFLKRATDVAPLEAEV